MKLKLKELYCSVIKLNNEGKAYVDIRVKLGDSPWVDYLNTGSTDKLYESFRATQKHPDHPDNYWYPIEKFGLLVENDNDQELYLAMNHALNNKDTMKKKVNESKAYMKRFYTEQVAEKYLNLFIN